MTIDFDRTVDRRGSDSLKWSESRGNDVIPMWVADMDFAAPECVIRRFDETCRPGVSLAIRLSPRR